MSFQGLIGSRIWLPTSVGFAGPAVYRSATTLDSLSAGPFTIAQPAGLTVDDLMVSFLANGVAATLTPPEGWTAYSSAASMALAYRRATAGDVSSWPTYSWTTSGSAQYFGMVTAAYSGANAIDGSVLESAGESTSYSSSSGITPTTGSALAVIMALVYVSRRTSAYAVATDNPTWTEDFDADIGGSGWYSAAHASGLRTSSQATGSFSFSLSSWSTKYVASFLIR